MDTHFTSAVPGWRYSRADFIPVVLSSPEIHVVTLPICFRSSLCLTVRNWRHALRFAPRPTEVTASPLSESDLIRINGLGVKW